jgi:hypothetical protein
MAWQPTILRSHQVRILHCKPRFLFCFLPHSFLGGVWKKVGSSPASYTKECRRIELLRLQNNSLFSFVASFIKKLRHKQCRRKVLLRSQP